MTRHRQHALGTLLLRLALGGIYVAHGVGGWRMLGPDGVAALMMRMGFPAEAARLLVWYLFVVHIVGGLLMIIGLWTVSATLAQLPIMASAVFLLHLPQGFFMHGIVVDAAAGRAIAGGVEFSFLVLVSTVALAMLGSGALSIDHVRAGTAGRREIP
ncbi:MAG: DoxX family protein [Candidatus Rokubacteria bacterium]|nr:DoxX family protein [Candidatus Rokubacteria bacterium]